MIGIQYNQSGQPNIKVLLVCPYDLNRYGGVQNQVKLLTVSIQKYWDHHPMIMTLDMLSIFHLMAPRTQ